MRVMVLIKANDDSEAGVLPDEQLLTDITKFIPARRAPGCGFREISGQS